MSRFRAAVTLGLLLCAGAAAAEDAVTYRMPDGSIGLADRSRVPPGAVILSSGSRRGPAAPASPAQSRDSHEAQERAAAEQRERVRSERQRLRDAAESDEAGLDPDREGEGSSSAADHYSDRQDELRAAAVAQREKAEQTPCRLESFLNRRGRWRTRSNCDEKLAESRKAEELERDLPGQLQALEDACMDDPDCAPREMRPYRR